MPKCSRRTCFALPALPAALPVPTRVREGLPAQGASEDGCPKRSASPSGPLRETGDEAPCFREACSGGGGRPTAPFRLREAGLLSRRTPVQTVLECVFRGGPRGHGRSGSGFRRPCAGLLGGRGKGAPCRMSGDPTAGNPPQAAAPTRGRDPFGLRERGLPEIGSSASSRTLGGKALVLSRVVQAQGGEGLLLRGSDVRGDGVGIAH